MVVRLLASLFLVVFLNIAQVWIRPWIPLANFLPLLIVILSFRMPPVGLALFILMGGWLTDFLTMEALGFSPLIWVIVMMLARSQRFFLERYSYAMIPLVSFAATFLFIGLGRIVVLTMRLSWSWDDQINTHLLMASLANALISPLALLLLRPIYAPLNVKQNRSPSNQTIGSKAIYASA